MHKYSNLIKDMAIIRPKQLWVSDTTYIRMYQSMGLPEFNYGCLFAYSHGLCAPQGSSAEGCRAALQMAVNARQYTRQPPENGSPYDNAIAERANGIIKNEFKFNEASQWFTEIASRVQSSIKAYNEMRLHASCDFPTPEKAHLTSGPLKKRWKPKVYKNLPLSPV